MSTNKLISNISGWFSSHPEVFHVPEVRFLCFQNPLKNKQKANNLVIKNKTQIEGCITWKIWISECLIRTLMIIIAASLCRSSLYSWQARLWREQGERLDLFGRTKNVNWMWKALVSFPKQTWMHLGQPVSPKQAQEEMTSKAATSSSLKYGRTCIKSMGFNEEGQPSYFSLPVWKNDWH